MLAVTADVHAHNYRDYATTLASGLNSRLVEIVRALEWAGTDALSRGARTFVVAGDLFHSRKAIDVTVLYQVSQAIAALAEKFEKVILLVGNHDLPVGNAPGNSLDALRSRNVQVVASPKIVPVKDEQGLTYRIGLIPWTNSREVVREVMKDFAKEDLVGIVGHLALNDAKTGPTDYEVPGPIKARDLCKGKHRWVLLGHYHKSQHWKVGAKLVAYVGSLLQHTWAERDQDKGYWFVDDPQGKPTMIWNTLSPRFVQSRNSKQDQAIRKNDYGRVTGPRTAARVKKIRSAKVIIVPEREDDAVPQRMPAQVEGDEPIVSAYLEHTGVPKGVQADDLSYLGLRLLRDE